MFGVYLFFSVICVIVTSVSQWGYWILRRSRTLVFSLFLKAKVGCLWVVFWWAFVCFVFFFSRLSVWKTISLRVGRGGVSVHLSVNELSKSRSHFKTQNFVTILSFFLMLWIPLSLVSCGPLSHTRNTHSYICFLNVHSHLRREFLKLCMSEMPASPMSWYYSMLLDWGRDCPLSITIRSWVCSVA